MTNATPEQFHFKATDEALEDLIALEGEAIDAVGMWDGSILDAQMDEPVKEDARLFVDFDLYFANHTLLELYGVSVFPDENSDPLRGMTVISKALEQLTREGARLEGVFTDEEEDLILKLRGERGSELLLMVMAWVETVWSELPDG